MKVGNDKPSLGVIRSGNELRARESMEDLTDVVAAAASTMSGEEMISAKSFSLYDAMSALELMDPRMDPEEALSLDPKAIDKKPSLAQARRAMWKLTEKEMAWQSGASSEEILDCALVSRTELLRLEGNEHARSFSSCLELSLRIVKLSHSLILWADVFEEEDFFAPQPPLPDIEEERDLDVAGEDHLLWRRLLLRALQGMSTKGVAAEGILEYLDMSLEVLQRLQKEDSSSSFWCVFSSERDGPATTDCDAARASCVKFVKGIRKAAELRAFFESGCGDMCRTLKADEDDRQQQQNIDDDKLGVRKNEECRALYRLLALVQSLQFEAIVPRSLAALELGAEFRRASNDDDAIGFAALGRGSKTVSLYDIVADGVRCDGTPACVAAQRPAIEWTAHIACPRLLDLLHALCFNRARLHQRLFRGHIFQGWGDVVVAARQADATVVKQLEIPPHRYLEVFAVRVALYLMNLNLELDVELELTVTPAELEPLFFYREYITTSALRLVSSARQYKSALEMEMHREICQERDRGDECLELFLQATLALCRGLRVLAASAAVGRRPLPFGTKDGHYRFRFEHFRALDDPPYVSYKQFKELTTTRGRSPNSNKNNNEEEETDTEQLLDYANEYLQRAKQATDALLKGGHDDDAFDAAGTNRANLVAMAKVAVANRVAIAKIKMQQPNNKATTVTTTFRFHPHFPVFAPSS